MAKCLCVNQCCFATKGGKDKSTEENTGIIAEVLGECREGVHDFAGSVSPVRKEELEKAVLMIEANGFSWVTAGAANMEPMHFKLREWFQ